MVGNSCKENPNLEEKCTCNPVLCGAKNGAIIGGGGMVFAPILYHFLDKHYGLSGGQVPQMTYLQLLHLSMVNGLWGSLYFAVFGAGIGALKKYLGNSEKKIKNDNSN